MPVTHGVASSSLVQTAKRVDELVSSALFCKMVIKKIFEHIQIHPLQLWKKIHSSGGNLSVDKYSYFDLSNKIATIKPELLKINDDTRKRRAAYAKAKKN